MAEAQPSFDLKTWNALVQTDADIASAATYLGQFGQRYVDDLADSYLAIGEKRYLAAIVAKIQRQAEDEARAGSSANPETPRTAGTANDNARSEPGCDPEFDVARWNELANEDEDIEAAIVAVGRFGSYYAADLAASYQAINEKRYLERIVETIIAEAQADLAHSTSAQSAPSLTAEPASSPKSDSTRGKSAHDDGQSARPPGSSAQTDTISAKAATERTRKGRANRELAFTALGIFLFLFAVAAGFMLYDYSVFRAGRGDASRLEAYEHNCWICAFASQARTEATALRLFAARAEELRIREEAVSHEASDFRQAQGDIVALERYVRECRICVFANGASAEILGLRTAEREAARVQAASAEDESEYRAARGDIDRLSSYLSACTRCDFRTNAEAELNTLRQQANIAAARARIAELQREQQVRAQAQASIPPHQVIWRMTNSSDLNIALLFFSKTRLGTRWPGINMIWPMNPGQSSDYNIECQSGEKICYGASAPFQTKSWGVGAFNMLGCDNCCVTCDGGVHIFNLVTDGGGPNE